jgi:hypothetical protein
MSEVGYLSYQQQRATELAGRLERLLAEFTEQRLSRQSRERLALSLQALVEVLDPLSTEAPDPQEVLRVPIAVAERLRRDDFHGRSFAVALMDLREHLLDTERQLDSEDRELLARIAATAAATAASTYRQMVRG